MQQSLDLAGEIVDQQAFLDGTREYTLEAETAPAGDEEGPWRLTLSFRWLKEIDESIEEGDLSLLDPRGSALYGTLVEGSAETVFDEDTADEAVLIDLTLEARSGEGKYAGWSGTIRVGGRLASDRAELHVATTITRAAD